MKKTRGQSDKKIEGKWLPFKHIIKDKKFHLIILFIILFWVILIQIVNTASEGGFALPSSDGYVVLTHAKGWYEGHPLSIYPNEPPVAKKPNLYAMILSLGYWLGFKSHNAFIFWTYLINLIMLLSTSLFLYRFFNKFFPEVAFSSTLLSTLFAPIFYNFFSCTTMPILFLLISAALAFLESLPFFLSFAILIGFTKSEGIIYYLFLSSLHLGLKKNNWRKLAIGGLLPLLTPFLINRFLIGQKMSQGTVSQFLFHYGSFAKVIETGTINFINHLKCTILGLYNPDENFGLFSQASAILTLPPLLFIFTIIGFLEKNKKIAISTAVFLLILIIGDSIITFTGVGYNRHLLTVFPLIFGFSLIGIKKFNKNIDGFYPAMLAFFIVFFLSQEIILFSSIKQNIQQVRSEREVAEWLNKNLPNETQVFDGTIGSKNIIFTADKMRFVLLTPNLNPIFGKHIKSFREYTETTELIQRFYPDVKYLLRKEDITITFLTKWLQTFSIGEEKQVFSWFGKDERYALYPLDLSVLKKKRFKKGIIDEVDIGDPFSESNHQYERVTAGNTEFSQMSHPIDGVYDAGRVTEGHEKFTVKVSESEKQQLTCLLGSNFEGKKLVLMRNSLSTKPAKFILQNPYCEIYVNDKKIFTETLKNDFMIINVPLPEKIKSEKLRITVKGNFVSYHYWVRKLPN